MRLPLSALLFASLAPTPAPARAAPARETDNVAAFARLYGVVRHFYPSDAAAELDWNRLAVHGTARVREARDAAELRESLLALFAPLGPGIEIGASLPEPPSGTSAGPLVAWRYIGAGFAPRGPYRGKRTHRAPPAAGEGGFVSLMQMLPADPWRGRTVRLRARVRAQAASPSAGAALWLRVDRKDQAMGFFDNMNDRLVRDPVWREYSIEGPVAEDAQALALGVMVVGAATADFDGIALEAASPTSGWTPVSVADHSFEASPGDSAYGAWQRVGPLPAVISRPAVDAPDGRQHLRIGPPAGGATDEELFEGAPPEPGGHVDLDIGSGLRARVPLVLGDAQARPDPARQPRLDALRAALAALPEAGEALDVDRRLADVVVAWSVFRHFYPYWSETGVDWDARLRPQLELAAAATTRSEHLDVLRRLTADARDGHAGVSDIRVQGQRAQLPVGFAVIDDRIVITTSAVPEQAPVGAEVTAIDGTPAEEWLRREMALSSGTNQWQRVRALLSLMDHASGTVRLGLSGDGRPADVTLSYGSTGPPTEPRPASPAEIEPGIWYVDLTRSKMDAVKEQLEAVASARAVIFDMRGYPLDAGMGILPHLLEGAESDRWMHVAKIVGPFGQKAGWQSFGWDLQPASPRIGGTVVFLLDGRAISYAESVMGYVRDRKLGTIVGSPSAGTNGNVASFTTPGGFSVRFTGMRVTRHDGTSPFHLLGVTPDIPVAPTVADIRAGRDPVLERALAVARKPPHLLREETP